MRSLGYTLTELLVVVALIGLAATVALPSLQPVDDAKLDLAAGEIAAAIRFARSETRRTGLPRGFELNDATARVRVARLDTSSTPFALAFDVYHPVDKKLYDRSLGQPPYAFEGTIATAATFRGTCTDPSAVYFDGNGSAWCADPAGVMIDQYVVTVSQGQQVAAVTLDGLTGRVTVQ